jgi:hypothetical protein
LPPGWTIDPLEDNGRVAVTFTHARGLKGQIQWWEQLPEDMTPKLFYDVILRGLYIQFGEAWKDGQASTFLNQPGWTGELTHKEATMVMYVTIVNQTYAPTFTVIGSTQQIQQMRREIEQMRDAIKLTSPDGSPTRQPGAGAGPAAPGGNGHANSPNDRPHQPAAAGGLGSFVR